MKTTYDEVLSYLLAEPRFRERKNKNKGFVNLLTAKYPSLRTFERERIIDILTDYATMNRSWSRILQLRKDLRGNDYLEKYTLQNQALQNYGYKKENQDMERASR